MIIVFTAKDGARTTLQQEGTLTRFIVGNLSNGVMKQDLIHNFKLHILSKNSPVDIGNVECSVHL